jgi:FMN reductase
MPPTSHRPFIVGLGGTTREGSTSERAMQYALAHAASLGCEVEGFGSAALPIEPYDPGRADRSTQAAGLVAALRRCDGLLLVSPSYHGGISGLIKNALDFTEDLRQDIRPYLTGRAVGCVVVAEGPQAMGSTLIGLRSVVHALRGWPTPYGAALNPSQRPLGDLQGQGADPASMRACEMVAAEVVEFARMKKLAAAALADGTPSV